MGLFTNLILPKVSSFIGRKVAEKVEKKPLFSTIQKAIKPTMIDFAISPKLFLAKKIVSEPKKTLELTKKTLELTKKGVKFGVDIARLTPRAIASAGIEPAAGILSLLKKKEVKAIHTPKTKIEKMLIGEEPIKGIFQRTDEAKAKIQPFLSKVLGSEKATGASLALAPLFVAGMTTWDLIPFGGGKNTAKFIAKSKNIDEIIKLVRPILKNEDEILRVAKNLIKETNPNKVKNILLKEVSAIKKFQPLAQEAKPLFKKLKPKEIETVKKVIPKLDDKIVENTLTKRIMNSDFLPKEIKQKIATDPSSFHTVLKDKEMELLVKEMSTSELHTLVNNDIGKAGTYASQELVNIYKKAGDLESANNVLRQAQKLSVRGGQIVQAQKRWKQLFDPELKMLDIGKQLEKYGVKLAPREDKILRTAFEKEWELSKQVDELADIAKKTLEDKDILAFEKLSEKLETASLNVSKIIGEYSPRTLAKTSTNVMIGNLLTIKSLIRNPLYNAVVSPMNIGRDIIAANADRLRSFITGKPREAYVGNIKGFITTLFGSGAKKGFKQVLTGSPVDIVRFDHKQALQNAYRGFQPIRDFVNAITGKNIPVDIITNKIKFRDRAHRIFSSFMGIQPEITFRLLSPGDVPFREAAKVYSLGKETKLAGKKVFMSNRAESEALAFVFQQEDGAFPAIANFVNRGLSKIEKIPVIGGLANFSVRSIIPFIKIPFNAADVALRFSSPGYGLARMSYYVKKGNTKKALLSLGEIGIAQMNRVGARTLIDADLIGDPEYSGKKQQSLKFKKIPPGYINISGLQRFLKGGNSSYRSGDTTMDFRYFGPFAAALEMELKSKKGEKFTEETEKTMLRKTADLGYNSMRDIFGLGSYLMDQSFLSGTNQLLNTIAVSADEQQGDYKYNQWMKSWFRTVSSIALPNNYAALNKTFNNYYHETVDKDWYETAKNTLKSKTPGFGPDTKDLPFKRGLFGEKIEIIGGAPSLLEKLGKNIFDPFFTKKINTDLKYREMIRLYDKYNDNSIIPSIPQRSFSKGGQKFNLDDNLDYEKFITNIGEAREENFNLVLEDPRYSSITDDEKIKVLKNIYSDGYDRGKTKYIVDMLIDNMKDLNNVEKNTFLREQEKLGIIDDDVFELLNQATKK